MIHGVSASLCVQASGPKPDLSSVYLRGCKVLCPILSQIYLFSGEYESLVFFTFWENLKFVENVSCFLRERVCLETKRRSRSSTALTESVTPETTETSEIYRLNSVQRENSASNDILNLQVWMSVK